MGRRRRLLATLRSFDAANAEALAYEDREGHMPEEARSDADRRLILDRDGVDLSGLGGDGGAGAGFGGDGGGGGAG